MSYQLSSDLVKHDPTTYLVEHILKGLQHVLWLGFIQIHSCALLLDNKIVKRQKQSVQKDQITEDQ